MRRILYVSGTRADYGLMEPVLRRIEADPALGLEIVATGMHLMPEFGMTVEEIERAGFPVRRAGAVYREDDKAAMAIFLGEFTGLLTKEVLASRPDLILLLGDRAEMLAGAIVGSYLSIPVAHIHGGEVTSTVDEHARHAITKLAHIHLAATPGAAERILRMGEEPFRVFTVGAPSLDPIVAGDYTDPSTVLRSMGLEGRRPVIVVLQHPVTVESDLAGDQVRATLGAIVEEGYGAVVIYPNADAGGRRIIRVIEEFAGQYPSIRACPSIPRRDFLGLLAGADLLVGNSSSGIIEAPSLHLPVVNIGNRQEGRERGENVLDVPPEKEAIRGAIEKALSDRAFRDRVLRCRNPYGDGHAAEGIVEVLRTVPLGKKWIQKRLAY